MSFRCYNTDITKIETRHPAQLVKAIDDKGVHDVAGRHNVAI